MKVRAAEYVKSALRPEDYPRDGRPEIAFAGRSNVGKSTLLNVLLNRKGLAKVSKTPGKTQAVNFFNVNGQVYFVDLPGYGFARVSKQMKRDWGRALTSYLSAREPLRLAVHLVDARHDPTARDLELLELLDTAEVPTLVVATKVDKVKPGSRSRMLKRVRKHLQLEDDVLVVPFSAVDKEGLHELWGVIDDCLAG